MPQSLSENPEEIVRQLLTDEWDNTNAAGYSPTVTDPTATNFLPISTDWNSGDVYPLITVTNNDPTVPGGGETNFTGVQGNGSGPNQRRLENMLVTIQASGDTSYNSGLSAHDVCQALADEIERIILTDNFNAPNHPGILNFFLEPFTHTAQSDDSAGFHQYQSTASIHWNRTP